MFRVGIFILERWYGGCLIGRLGSGCVCLLFCVGGVCWWRFLDGCLLCCVGSCM